MVKISWCFVGLVVGLFACGGAFEPDGQARVHDAGPLWERRQDGSSAQDSSAADRPPGRREADRELARWGRPVEHRGARREVPRAERRAGPQGARVEAGGRRLVPVERWKRVSAACT
jgi:hypothetical protein